MSRCTHALPPPLIAFLFAIGILLQACGSAPTEDVQGPDDNSTFGLIQKKIFTPSCATTGCHSDIHESSGKVVHDNLPTGGLYLTKEYSYDALYDVSPVNDSARGRGMKRVKPGDPDHSYLFAKLTGHLHDGDGLQMPLGSRPLDSGSVEFIRQWIEAGAPRTGTVADTAYLNSGHGPSGLLPPPLPEHGLLLHLPVFKVPPHGEHEVFYATRSPLATTQYITKIRVKMTDHSHHFQLYDFEPNDNFTPPENVLRDRYVNFNEWAYDRKYVFATQEADVTYQLPPGVGIELKPYTLFDVNQHSVNDFDDTADAECYVAMETADHVDHVAHSLEWSTDKIRLMPGAWTSVKDTLEITDRKELITLTTHFHKHGKVFSVYYIDASGIARLIYENHEWHHPEIHTYTPPIDLKPGDKLTLEAQYFNDTDHIIYYGPSADDDMCVVFGLTVDP